MNRCLVVLLFGIILCYLNSATKDEILPANPQSVSAQQLVPIIQNDEEITPNYGSLLPAELWDYLIDFIDFETGQNLALVSKTFHYLTQSSNLLHLKRVEKWMSYGRESDRHKCMLLQDYLIFDKDNSYLKVNPLCGSMSFLSLMNLKPLLAATRRIDKLNLPSLKHLLLFRKEDGTFTQRPIVKELTLKIMFDVVCFPDGEGKIEWIPAIFTELKTLRLNLEWCDTKSMPFSTNDLFTAMPKLGKLIIRILSSARCVVRKDLISMLKILQDKRIVLEFERNLMDSQELAALVFDIFNTDFKDQDKQFKMRKRVFFYVNYESGLKEIIYENQNQVYFMELIVDEDSSPEIIFSNLGRFTQLRKLNLFLESDVNLEDFPCLNLKPFLTVTDLTIRCCSKLCKTLFSKLHLIFPNITVLHVTYLGAGSNFKAWLNSLKKLKKLKKLDIDQSVTRQELYDIFQVVSTKKLPNLKVFRFPRSKDENNGISEKDLFIFLKQWVLANPSIVLKENPYPLVDGLVPRIMLDIPLVQPLRRRSSMADQAQ